MEGILGLMEEIRDDKINELVAQLQGAIRAYYARRIYKKLYDHKYGLLVAQRTIRNFMIGEQFNFWNDFMLEFHRALRSPLVKCQP